MTVPWMTISLTTDDACVMLSETKGLQFVILLSAQFDYQNRQDKEPDYWKELSSHHHSKIKSEYLTQKNLLEPKRLVLGLIDLSFSLALFLKANSKKVRIPALILEAEVLTKVSEDNHLYKLHQNKLSLWMRA